MKEFITSTIIFYSLFADAKIFYRGIGVSPEFFDLSYRAKNYENAFWLTDDLGIATSYGIESSLDPSITAGETSAVILKLEIPEVLVRDCGPFGGYGTTGYGYHCLPYDKVKNLKDYVEEIGIGKKYFINQQNVYKIDRWFTLDEFQDAYSESKI